MVLSTFFSLSGSQMSNMEQRGMKQVLCFAVVFGIAYLVLRCAKPSAIFEKDASGHKKVNEWKVAGLSLLAAVLVCLLMAVSRGGQAQ